MPADLDEFRAALEALEDRFFCEGSLPIGGPVSISLPEGEAASECEDDHPAFPPRLRVYGYRDVAFARLARPLSEADLASVDDCVTFVPPFGDGGGYFEDEVTCLEPFLDEPIPAERWLIRRAAAMLLRKLDFAEDGFVGNAACESYLYRIAALEVTRPTLPAAGPGHAGG